jgi:ankyrin repeat protein
MPSAREELHLSFVSACAQGDEDVIQDLLDGGCDPNETDGRGMSCVHYAAEHGSANAINCLVRHCPDLQLDTQDTNGWSPVLYAAARGHLSTVEALSHHGASLNLPSSQGRTAMHWASLNAHVPLINWFLQPQRRNDVNINATDRSGWTALHCAGINGHTESIRVLLAGGVDPRILDKLGRSARDYCEEEVRGLFDMQQATKPKGRLTKT